MKRRRTGLPGGLALSAGVLLVFFISLEAGSRLKYRHETRRVGVNVAGRMDFLRRDLERRRLPARDIHDYIYHDNNNCVRMMPNSRGLHRNNADLSTKVLIGINSEGIRGPELLPAPRTRILFLGDSLVFSGGLPLPETFVHRLERLLNPEAAERSAYGTEVLNFGTSDLGVDQYYLKLKHHGLSLDPDYVFVGLYLNDAVAPQGYMGVDSVDAFERLLETYPVSELKSALYIKRLYRTAKYSNLETLRQRFRWNKRFTRRAYIKDKGELLKLVEEADLDWGAAWREKTWGKVRFYLKAMKRLCDRKGVRLVVFLFPVEPQVAAEVDWEGLNFPQRRLMRLARELSIPAFDLLPALRARKDLDLYVDHCHFKSEGSRVVAEAIGRIIRENARVFPDLEASKS